MRILYASGNRPGSFFQMQRFLVANKKHTIKIAAYKDYIGDIDIDFNLDCLLNFTKPNGPISFNGNYVYYSNEIKRFAPDLIISDLEIFTSIIAGELNIKLWQYSPILLYNALPLNIINDIGIHNKYYHLFNLDFRKIAYYKNILNNSDKKFVISHLGDANLNLKLNNGYEFIRPDFILGNGNLLDDVYIFGDTKIKTDDYKKMIEKCNNYITDGTMIFLADAFYNQHYCGILPNYKDTECLIGSLTNEYFGFGKIIHDNKPFDKKEIIINIDDKVKFLSEKIEEL